MQTTTKRMLIVLFLGAMGGVGTGGCSANGGDNASSHGSAGTGGNGLIEAGPSDGSLNEANACAADSYPGKLVPLDMHVMLDQSLSMDHGGKWTSVVKALKTFFSADTSQGVGVSLNYFPVPPSKSIPNKCQSNTECGVYGPCVVLPVVGKTCESASYPGTSCDGDDYATPALPVGVLPSYRTQLSSSLNAHEPKGDATPTQPAMAGVVGYATSWAKAHPSHLTFVVFATDGDPVGCRPTGGITATEQVASWAASQTPPVKTFIIGVGSELADLNGIASAGGTGKAFLVDTGADVAEQFITALNEIRAEGACKFQIPVPSSGTPDYHRVNVAYSEPPKPKVDLKNVPDESHCDAAEGGWFYDNPSDPKMILLCQESCDMVRSGDGEVNVLLGCATLTR